MKLTQKAKELDAELTSMETQITLAIAHLKNNSGRSSRCPWKSFRLAQVGKSKTGMENNCC